MCYARERESAYLECHSAKATVAVVSSYSSHEYVRFSVACMDSWLAVQ